MSYLIYCQWNMSVHTLVCTSFLYLTHSEEESKTSGRGPPRGDDISDIEHLLDDQPTSESNTANSMSISRSITKPYASLLSPEGQAAEAGRGSGEATLSLAAGERGAVAQWWHHAAVLSRALWNLSPHQVGRTAAALLLCRPILVWLAKVKLRNSSSSITHNFILLATNWLCCVLQVFPVFAGYQWPCCNPRQPPPAHHSGTSVVTRAETSSTRGGVHHCDGLVRKPRLPETERRRCRQGWNPPQCCVCYCWLIDPVKSLNSFLNCVY